MGKSIYFLGFLLILLGVITALENWTNKLSHTNESDNTIEISHIPVTKDTDASGYVTVTNIPIGDTGVYYWDSPMGPLGPSSFRVLADKNDPENHTFWIDDRYGRRFVHFNSDDTLLQTVMVPEEIVDISDFIVKDGIFTVLDRAGYSPILHTISSQGALLQHAVLPADPSITGLRETKDGFLIEHEEGSWLSDVHIEMDNTATLTNHVSYMQLENNSNGFTITNGVNSATQEIPNFLGAHIIDSPVDDIIPIVVSEDTPKTSEVFDVKQSLWLLSKDLQLLVNIRLPFEKQHVYIEDPVVLASDGKVFGLITFSDHISVIKFITPFNYVER